MTYSYKLKTEVKRVVGLLRRTYKPEKIILFGSLANGTAKKWSDADLLIVKKTNKRFLDRIGEVLKLCRPKEAIDFLVYTPAELKKMSIEEPFVRDEIIGKGKVLYEA